MQNKLSIIIPAYNEEHRIVNTLEDIHNTMFRQSLQYEILVVNDGSKDNTVKIVESLKSTVSNLSLIDNDENHGKGWVVKQGMLEANGDFMLFMDADNSTKVEEVLKMLPYIKEGFDVVIGSRRLPESNIVIKQNLARDFLGFIFRSIVHLIVPLDVNDSQCGFKLFTRKAVKVIFPKQTIYGWSFDVEILAIAKKNNLKIKEIPVVWRNDSESRMTIINMYKSLIELIRIRFETL